MPGGDFARSANTIDVVNSKEFMVRNNVTAMRTWVSDAKRKLADLTKNLNTHRMIERSHNRIAYRKTEEDLDRLSEDNNMKVSSEQARESSPPVKQTPSALAHATNRAKDQIPGIRGVEAPQTETGELIKKIQADIKHYEDRLKLKEVQAILNDPEKTALMAEDRVYRTRFVGASHLYSLHVSYRMMTTDPVTASRKNPENDSKVTSELVRLRNLFNSMALRYDADLYAKLDHLDIGSDINHNVLREQLELLRAAGPVTGLITAAGSELSAAGRALAKTITVANDQFSSKNMKRTPVATMAQANSMKARTASYPNAVVVLWGQTYKGISWSMPSLKDSVENGWKKKTSKNSKHLPGCTTKSLSPADQEKADAEAKAKAAETKGADNFKNSMTRAAAATLVSKSEALDTMSTRTAEIQALFDTEEDQSVVPAYTIKVETVIGTATLSAYWDLDVQALKQIELLDADSKKMVADKTLVESDRLTAMSYVVDFSQPRLKLPSGFQ